uniref:beta-1,4-galactosyltransferase 1-like n=1 Tax=Oncorhynchus gorbuscha TaxID=8017 RepID=UPI001EAE875A|nr:beta-1,4-galactosyltransferase 1-like [Oncorhynchus gorbuscha]
MLPLIHGFWLGKVLIVTEGTTSPMHLLINSLTESAYTSVLLSEAIQDISQINEDGENMFNRAKLVNIGYAEALKEYDYDCFVFSGVDIIPMDDRNPYKCFSQPRHLSVSVDKFGFKVNNRGMSIPRPDGVVGKCRNDPSRKRQK